MKLIKLIPRFGTQLRLLNPEKEEGTYTAMPLPPDYVPKRGDKVLRVQFFAWFGIAIAYRVVAVRFTP